MYIHIYIYIYTYIHTHVRLPPCSRSSPPSLPVLDLKSTQVGASDDGALCRNIGVVDNKDRCPIVQNPDLHRTDISAFLLPVPCQKYNRASGRQECARALNFDGIRLLRRFLCHVPKGVILCVRA